MSFSTQSVHDFIGSLASAAPTPGGGTAAAIAGAMGTGLFIMVAGLARTRGNTDDERAALAGIRSELLPLTAAFETCADRDSDAFNVVMAAYKRPKGTDEEKAARKAAIAEGMRGATDAPLETLRVAARALALGETVARLGNPSAASDAGVGAGLLAAAAHGAAANVRINLEGMQDEAYRAGTEKETATLLQRVDASYSAIRTAIG
ncbi:MAG TPA: cyclodeaminase/cyclohydrolase family protein [Vicinamibacterales bacterium]|jgi:formiminotetrahydrofolate cyclodeaminase|nr:cyclodeaminase/cyclohydrolase family protein [Vicinamibacterales bacterium]